MNRDPNVPDECKHCGSKEWYGHERGDTSYPDGDGIRCKGCHKQKNDEICTKKHLPCSNCDKLESEFIHLAKLRKNEKKISKIVEILKNMGKLGKEINDILYGIVELRGTVHVEPFRVMKNQITEMKKHACSLRSQYSIELTQYLAPEIIEPDKKVETQKKIAK